jgi:hypothetical protein
MIFKYKKVDFRISIIILSVIVLFIPCNSRAEEESQSTTKADCQTNLNIEFEADEKLFTFLAWMSWVSDDVNPLKVKQFGEQEELKEELKSIPEEIYLKHKAAYKKYMSSTSVNNQEALIDLMRFSKEKDYYQKYRLANPQNYLKNTLLISDSQYYDYPPSFDLMPNRRLKDLPSAELLQEFYQLANIKYLWETRYKEANLRMIELYADNARKLLDEALCFLKIKQDYPVSIRFNRLDSFGTSGQTSYSEAERKYILKIHLEPDAKPDYILQVVRHEFAHSLLNDTVKENRHLIDDSLKKVVRKLKLKTTVSPEELLAQCIANLQYIKSSTFIRENIHFYYKNILFMHFTEKIPDFLASGKSYTEYIPELFRTYDPDKEITRWENIERRVKGFDLNITENNE